MTARWHKSWTRLANGVDRVLEASIALSFSTTGIRVRRRLLGFDASPRLDGRCFIITGATSGIGLATAMQLARLGAHLHIIGRDETRTEIATTQIDEGSQGSCASSVLDLRHPTTAAELGRELRARYPTLDGLVHNAGSLNRFFLTGPDGTDATVATQLLTPYALTSTLASSLERSDDAVVVIVSSGRMYSATFDLGTLEMDASNYDGVVAYARVKRAQVALANGWSRHFAPTNVASYSMHPGWVDTPGLRSGLPRFAAVMRPFLRTPDEGADTVAWLASGAARAQGSRSGLFLDRAKRSESRGRTPASSTAQEDALLEWCAARTGLPVAEPD